MKRRLLLLGVLAITTLFSSTAFAENRGGAVVISPVIGGYHFDGTQGIDPNILYGLKLGYNFTDRLGIEALGHFVHTKNWSSGSAKYMDAVNYRLEMLYHLFPQNSLVPFLAVGGGGLSSYFDKGHKDVSGVVSYGAGVKYALSDNVALRADARMMSVFWNPSVIYNYEYTVGLGFQLGGVSKAVKAAEAPPAAKEVVAEPAAAPEPVAEPVPAPAPAPVRKPAPEPAPAPAPAPAPSASIAVTPQSITPGGSSTLSWKSQNSTSCSIQPGIGPVQSNGNMIVSPSDNTSYTLTCVGQGGSASSATTLAIAKPVLKPVTAAPDADRDGVPDALDTCLNTPYGIKVDKDGCPLHELACKSFTLKIEFDTGKADIKPNFQQEIKKVADFLKENPDAAASIEGHTDNVGSAANNQKLSQKRADAVLNYLVKKLGINSDKVAAKGFGLKKPTASNKTAQGRAKNRRVEALIFCADKKD